MKNVSNIDADRIADDEQEMKPPPIECGNNNDGNDVLNPENFWLEIVNLHKVITLSLSNKV